MSRRLLSLLVLAVALPAVVLVVAADPVAAAGNGLSVSSTTTYTIDPTSGVVHVLAQMTLTNTIPDQRQGGSISRRYFTGFALPAPAGALNPVATAPGGRVLRLQPRFVAGNTNFVVYDISLAGNLFYPQTAHVDVNYDITGLPPRSRNPSRVNAAYAAFDAWGIGDNGKVTVRVVVPPGFTSDTFGDTAAVTKENGNTVYTATNIPNPDRFTIFVSARNDAGLAGTDVTTALGDRFNLRSWPGDAAWPAFVTTQIHDGVPALATLIGQPWPIDSRVEVREAYTPYLYGYAGWFSAGKDLIEVGEDLDQEVVLHELSHAWFNDKWFSDRWINEGMAQVYSNKAIKAAGGTPNAPEVVHRGDAGAVQLNDWGNPDFTSGAGAQEKYGYNAAFSVTEQVVDDVGAEKMHAVFAAVANQATPYAGHGTAETVTGTTGWRRFLDLVDEVGGATKADDLFRSYVVASGQLPTLDARATARDAYHRLVKDGGTWAAPVAVRSAMAGWDFTPATSLIKDSEAVLALRDQLDGESKDLGVAYPTSLQHGYEGAGKDLVAVTTQAHDEITTADRLLAAVRLKGSDHGLFGRVGLLGTNLTALLDHAKAAFASGDNTTARSDAQKVVDTITAAPGRGRRRSLLVLAGVALLFAVPLTVRSARRRRRHASHLDEDALAGTGEGGVDHLLAVPDVHHGEAAGATGIVEGNAGLGDVGDPILQLHEHVVAAVDAQAVSGAEILVDPDAHEPDPTGATVLVPVPAVTLGAVQPPTAKQVPHVWSRPTGDAQDPWAWLRDSDDPDTIAYLTAENAWSDAWFAGHSALADSIFAEIKSRVQEDDLSAPVRKGPWWYVTRTAEGSSYAIHCRGRSAATATEQVLLDENVAAEGHEYFSVNAFDVNPQHSLLAWSSDIDGSEQYTMRFRDLVTGQDLVDEITGTTWGGTGWAADGHTLFYVTADEQMRPYRVWRHRVGTAQAEDVIVFEEPDERFYVYVDLTRSGEWITIDTASKVSSEVWVIPAGAPETPPAIVRPRADDVEYTLDHWGDRWAVLTNLDAVDFRVMTAPVTRPADWSELVPHVAGRRIVAVEAFRDHLVLHEWAGAQPRLRVLFGDGRERVVHVSDEPHDVELEANPEFDAGTIRYLTQSLTSPVTVYEEDVRSGERTLLKQTPVPGADLAQYRAQRLWATAPDGTAVPVDVVHHRDVAPDGSAPLVVYAYGSYESSMPPWFSVARLSLLDRGVVWALAHPRGGGELGREWYLQGKLEHKRNTFLDTIACAEQLVTQGWADPARLAVRGGSAGGLLVGVCITMRPELWRAAVAEVPFVDIVTTMSDPSLPLTVTEWEEWGDPRREPFASYMLSYSPYDNTVPAAYPALFVTAGLNDPRVSFHEPAKWVAKLRAVRTDDATLLLRCEMGSGHGGPSGRYESWREEARVLTFLLTELS